MSLEDVLKLAGVAPPARLTALRLLIAGGGLPVADPTDRSGLHPLVIPLARDEEVALGFLRWPTPPEAMPLPIVRQDPTGLHLVARSTDEMLHKELVMRDLGGEPLEGLLEAAGDLYVPGTAAASGLPLNAFLLLRVGVTPGFFEELVEAHLERGDEQAAIITAERACRAAPGWSRPRALLALLLEKLGKLEQARDTARMALLDPIWTLGMPIAPIAVLAGWQGAITGAPFRRLADNPKKPVLDRAAHLMDAVAAEGGSWDDLRPSLAALYREAELHDVAALVDG